MGLEYSHQPVKLILPILFSDIERKRLVLTKFENHYGVPDFKTEPFEFRYTHYYDSEMGLPIYRQFIGFPDLIHPEELVNIKKFTNRLELIFSENDQRKVNLDPGYMQEGKFILATTKDQQHRIYIRDGIYEEVTLFYKNKQWQPYPWTYPDYASQEYRDIFLNIRKIYVKQLKSG